MSEPATRPQLSWRAGGLVLLFGILLTLAATARILWPVLTRPNSHMIGDGTHPESYGFDLGTLLVSRAELAASGMPRDGVPVLDEPPRIHAAQIDSLAHRGVAKYLVSNDLVLGVERGGHACCYPLLALQWHEVVNDTLGGELIAVVYNPLCDAAMVFARTRSLRFGASGLVWNSNLLLYDRGTAEASLWSPLQARAIAGPAAMRGDSLRVLPSMVVPWRVWRALHPETAVLARKDEYFERYRRQPYAAYFGDDRLRFPVHSPTVDQGLPLKTPCLVLRAGSDGLILPIPRLLARADADGSCEIPFDGSSYRVHGIAEPPSAWIGSSEGPLASAASGFLFAWQSACPEYAILR